MFGRRYASFRFLVLAGGILPSLSLGSMTLKGVFDEALSHTEMVPAENTHVEQAQERRVQAIGRLLPSLSFSTLYQRQENAHSATGTSQLAPDQTTAKFTLIQPLFHGFGDFAEYRSRLAGLSASEATRENARLQLYQTVAKAFYGLLAARADQSILEKTLELTKERVSELQKRAGIGRSRKSEVLAARTQLVGVQAQVEAAEQAMLSATEQFRFATGLTAIPDVSETRMIDSIAIPEISFLVSQIENRPDVRAQKYNLNSASEQIVVARAGHFPSLDFSGNYYVKRTGALANVDWDLGLQLTVPLFQGGAIQAAVRENVEKEKDADLTLARTRRNAATEVRTLYDSMKSQVRQFKTLQEAETTAEESYREQSKDFRYGLVTNIDVIQALNTYQDSRRQTEKIRFAVLTTEALLEAAVGKLP